LSGNLALKRGRKDPKADQGRIPEYGTKPEKFGIERESHPVRLWGGCKSGNRCESVTRNKRMKKKKS